MEIILKKDIEKLGYKNDIVNVKNGYARNFLVPKGMAVVATESERKVHAENMRQSSHKEQKAVAEATAILEAIQGATIKVGAKVGESGKIFGSVTNVQLVDAITKLGHSIDRKNITLKGDAIKAIGTYEAELALYKSVKGLFSFEVIAD